MRRHQKKLSTRKSYLIACESCRRVSQILLNCRSRRKHLSFCISFFFFVAMILLLERIEEFYRVALLMMDVRLDSWLLAPWLYEADMVNHVSITVLMPQKTCLIRACFTWCLCWPRSQLLTKDSDCEDLLDFLCTIIRHGEEVHAQKTRVHKLHESAIDKIEINVMLPNKALKLGRTLRASSDSKVGSKLSQEEKSAFKLPWWINIKLHNFSICGIDWRCNKKWSLQADGLIWAIA